ncbi:PAS domain-containing protein [Sulfitobacter sp. DSM 110093]|uniref:PAS domain-containing protein n=1 Tax=Sulfitobacter sp. DSM 110093 TaxID=2883127 RepID=UPI001FADD531|nr:PAS domain-containing protein [Sulfitobacter sp. DSM 110093]
MAWLSLRLKWPRVLRRICRASAQDSSALPSTGMALDAIPVHGIVYDAKRRVLWLNLYGPPQTINVGQQDADGSSRPQITDGDKGRIIPYVKACSAEIEIEFDHAGRVHHANQEACGVTYGLGDCLVGQDIADLFGPRLGDGAKIGRLVQQIWHGAQQQGCFEMHPGEETARIVAGAFTAVLAPDGAVRGIRFLGAEVAANCLAPTTGTGHQGRPKRALPH